jgi:hypothetical protein
MKAYSSIQNRFKVLLSLWIGAVVFGCSSYPDVNRDPAKNNQATFRQDAVDCAQAYPESESGVYIKQRIGCMNLKGWR